MFSTITEKSIKSLIEKEGYLTHEIDETAITTDGGNHFGELFELNVKGKTKDGDKTTNLFLKVSNGDASKRILINNMYQAELFAYKELSVVFAELQEDANVPLRERYEFVKCYEDSSTEAIILENIAKKGFITNHRMDVVSLEFAEMSMRELAKFHGLSFALQEKRPDYFNRNIKQMKYPVIYWDDWPNFGRSMINISTEYINDDVKNRVKNLKLADKCVQLYEDQATRRCLCHGDYRANNVMIKLNDGKISDSKVVDYQFLHYGCPAMDIIYFIFISTDHNFRNAHLAHLKDVYHESLTTFLKYFNLDVDSVYSREMFEQDFIEKLDYGMVVSFIILPFIIADEDDMPNIAGDTSEVSFQVSDVFKDRQRGIIEELIKSTRIM